MLELGVWVDAAVCMIVSLSISFWAGRLYKTFWPKFAFFLIASIVGFTLFPLLSGVWQGAAPKQEHLIDAESRKQFWPVIGGVVAMAYFGAWRLQEIMDNSRKG